MILREVKEVKLLNEILQWNARSLIANGQEFKRFVHQLTVLPEMICIQEMWLHPQVNLIIPGYRQVGDI